MHIVLIGFMGAGKSKSSHILQERLGIPRWSTDELIVNRSSHDSVASLFAAEGEQVFRDRETEILRELLSGEPLVLDTGGGIVEREENRQLLQDCPHPVFYLQADFDTIYERVGGDERRPLMLDRNQAFERYTRRLDWYASCADYCINANVGDPGTRAEEVLRIMNQRSAHE